MFIQRGFTLIELLVVVIILGILASAALVTLDPIAQFNKANDAKKVAELQQLKTSIESYYDDHNSFPLTMTFGAALATNGTTYSQTTPQDSNKNTPFIYQVNPDNPQWAVIYAKLASPSQSKTSCELQSLNNCLPQNYANAGYNYCAVVGTPDCNYIAESTPAFPTPTPKPSSNSFSSIIDSIVELITGSNPNSTQSGGLTPTSTQSADLIPTSDIYLVGYCEVNKADFAPPGTYDQLGLSSPDSGTGYARIKELPYYPAHASQYSLSNFFGSDFYGALNSLQNSCTTAIYKNLLNSYCNTNTNPATMQVVVYKANGSVYGNGSSRLNNYYYSCSAPPATVTPAPTALPHPSYPSSDILIGECEVRDVNTALPAMNPVNQYNLIESTKSYARVEELSAGTIDPYDTEAKYLKTYGCTSPIYQDLMNLYCAKNTNPAYWEYVLYDRYGNVYETGGSPLGAGPNSCAGYPKATPTPIPTPYLIPSHAATSQLSIHTIPSTGSSWYAPSGSSSYPYIIASDGSWCYDSRGNDPVIFSQLSSPGSGGMKISIHGGSQGFCEDNTGIYPAYCDASGKVVSPACNNISWPQCGNPPCQPTHMQCDVYASLACNTTTQLGDVCSNGACTNSQALPPTPIQTVPSNFTLRGHDGSWCYDSNGNGIINVKGTCQDNKGLYTNYCSGINVNDYYCTGSWDGVNYTNVGCQVAVHSCSFTHTSADACTDGHCLF